MIRKILQETVDIVDDLGNDLRLEYYITEKHGINSNIVYGVLIEKYINHYTTLEFKENDSVLDLTYSYHEVKSICCLLANNKVTPMSLVYILDDMVNYTPEKKLLLI